MARGDRSIRAALLGQHLPRATSLAVALAEPQHVDRIVARAFSRCFGRLAHMREPQAFEMQLLREVVRLARRRGALPHQAFDETAALYLTHVEQLSLAAVAEAMGSTEGRVRNRLKRAEDRVERTDGLSFEVATPFMQPDRASEIVRRSNRRIASTALGVTVALAGLWVAIASTGGTLVRPPPERRAVVSLPNIITPRFLPRGEQRIAATGFAGGQRWVLRTYPAEHRTVCIELRVEETYGTAHCLDDFSDGVRGFIGPDNRHDMTFIFGYTTGDVEKLTISERGSTAVNVELADVAPEAARSESARAFVVSLPNYLLPLSDRAQGKTLGYRVYTLKLRAVNVAGDVAGVQTIFLGRPR